MKQASGFKTQGGFLMMSVLPVAAALLVVHCACIGQVSVRTGTFSFGNASLEITAEFVGEKGNAWLGARGSGTITLNVTNTGTATAKSAIATLSTPMKNVRFEREHYIGDIRSGESKVEEMLVFANEEVRTETGIITVEVNANPGEVAESVAVEVPVKGFPGPHLEVVVLEPETSVPKGELVSVKAQVRNDGDGTARGVRATAVPVGSDPNVTFEGLPRNLSLGVMEKGSAREFTFRFLANRQHDNSDVPFVVRIVEERQRFSVAETLAIGLHAPVPGPEELAFLAFRKGDYKGAIALFEKVVSSGKASREVFLNLGMAYFRTGDSPKCLDNVQKAARLGSKEARRWLAENTVSSEGITVTYKPLPSDPFAGYSPPIGLGIFNFQGRAGRETGLAEKFFEALKSGNESFRIYPYPTLREEQNSLGLPSLDPSNRQVLGALEKELSVNFIVTGAATDENGSSFKLQLIRCADGVTVATQDFRPSTSSFALNDAILFLLKRQIPVYTRKQTLEVKAR